MPQPLIINRTSFVKERVQNLETKEWSIQPVERELIYRSPGSMHLMQDLVVNKDAEMEVGNVLYGSEWTIKFDKEVLSYMTGVWKVSGKVTARFIFAPKLSEFECSGGTINVQNMFLPAKDLVDIEDCEITGNIHYADDADYCSIDVINLDNLDLPEIQRSLDAYCKKITLAKPAFEMPKKKIKKLTPEEIIKMKKTADTEATHTQDVPEGYPVTGSDEPPIDPPKDEL